MKMVSGVVVTQIHGRDAGWNEVTGKPLCVPVQIPSNTKRADAMDVLRAKYADIEKTETELFGEKAEPYAKHAPKNARRDTLALRTVFVLDDGQKFDEDEQPSKV